MDLIAHFSSARNAVDMPAGAVLFAEGDPGTHMYVLIQGKADICIGDEVVENAAPPALLGEMAIIDPGARSATVVLRSASRLVPIDSRQFDLLVRESPEFARQVMKVMARRLRVTNESLRQAIGEVSAHGKKPK